MQQFQDDIKTPLQKIASKIDEVKQNANNLFNLNNKQITINLDQNRQLIINKDNVLVYDLVYEIDKNNEFNIINGTWVDLKSDTLPFLDFIIYLFKEN